MVALLLGILVCPILGQAQASSPVGSGFADELDVKYGVVDQDAPSGAVVRRLIRFQEGAEFQIPKLGQTLEMEKDQSILGLDSLDSSPMLGETRSEAAPVQRRSRGTLLRAVGSFTVADWIAKVDARPDVLSGIRSRAMATASAPSLIELGEISQDEQDDMELAVAKAMVGNTPPGGSQLGDSVESLKDESETMQPRRPGWQPPIPGAKEQRDLADFLVSRTQAGVKAGSVAKAPKETAPEAPKRKKIEGPLDPMKHKGCYETGDKAVLPVPVGDGLDPDDRSQPNSMNPDKCARLCLGFNLGYTLMGLQTMGIQSFCYCGKSTGIARKVSADKCDSPCAGSPELKCGGATHMSVFLMDLKSEDESCWTGHEMIAGLDPKKPWERYRGCAICDGDGSSVETSTENWQLWGQPMDTPAFASCLSCNPLDALVVTDPKRGAGFCTSYKPQVDAVVSHIYPYYAHFDGASQFTHTKFLQKIVSPNMRSGKASALCKMWKQVSCSPNKKMLRKAYDQFRGESASDVPEVRYLECRTLKTISCNKVCLANKGTSCGLGGIHVKAFPKDGLKSILGKGSPEQAGDWCCFDKCQIPESHAAFKEDGSFWCKDAAMLL